MLCWKSCDFHGFCWEFCYYLNCYSSQLICCFTEFENCFFFFFGLHYSWCRFLWVHLTSWQYNSVCFAEFTNHLAIISSNILLAPPAFVFSFVRYYVTLFVCSVTIALKSVLEFTPAHASWCPLVALLLFTPVSLDVGVSVIFKYLRHFDSPLRRLLVLLHPCVSDDSHPV